MNRQIVIDSTQVPQGPRRSDRIRQAPEKYGFLLTYCNDIMIVDQNEPTSYQKAISSPDSEKWLEAMKSEMQSMYDNQVWTLIDPHDGLKTIAMCIPLR